MTTVGGLAPYILPAEVILAVLIVAGARWCRGAGALIQLAVTGLIALTYAGAATVSWLLIERTWLAAAA